jgi:amino acid adenylation domain-containing protein
VLDVSDRLLPDLIAERAARRPDAVAVRQWDDTLTYGELLAIAAGVAAALRERGAAPETLVGVCAQRHPSLVAALVGVLLSGAAYVPLDPALPVARLRGIAAEAGLSTVVCDGTGADLFGDLSLPILDSRTRHSAYENPRSSQRVGADAAAYVMFTSGSTGQPKGVVVPHRALAHFVAGLAATAGLDETCRSIAFASIGFDVSVIDLFVPLALGGSVALAGSADRADPARLQRFCAEHRATFGDLPPAILPLLDPGGLPDLRLLMTGSEAPGPEQVARWTADGRRFWNCYGPTEATVQVTWYEASGGWDAPLPIGRPTPNHRVYVVDEGMRQVGIGVPGELLVGGPGLARGYLDDPALTAQRFVPDPFSNPPGERLYRTGDLVTWRPDGTLEFLGRTDRQLKIRGQRVEIGEVEAVLRGDPDVGHAAVAAVPAAGGGLDLVAFVTGDDPDPAAVRRRCAERLPAAMVPARVVPVAALPLGSTGKVDLDRLVAALPPDPSAAPGGPDQPFQPPATPEEEQVAAAWAELLGSTESRVSRDDDFFDRGGHSITAMRLVAALRARLRRDVSIEDILAGRTLAAIACRVAAAAPLGDGRPVRGRPPALSPAQQRLWFLDRYAPGAAAAYNIAMVERLRGPLDVAALRAALDAVARRQEVLRWRMPDVDGVPHAVVDPPGPVPLPVEDVAPGDQERHLAARLAAVARERFDLGTDKLWRVRLFRLGRDHHVLAIVAHHAVFDGWSQALLYDDLSAAYSAAVRGADAGLPALPATYADYVAWRVERDEHRAGQDLAWWLAHLEGVPAVLELPADRPRPAEQSFAGAYAGRWLEAGATADLARFARDLGATPPAVLLAALGIVAARLTGQTDLVVGSPMVDRRHADFEPMVGFCIEIAPLRLRPEGRAGFAEHVRRARDELLAALAHPAAPLDRIVREFGLGGQVSRGPLVQVLFNMFNFAAPRLDLAGLASEPVPVEVPGSPFDLTVYGVERDGRLRIEVVYNADLFDAGRMAALLDSLREVIRAGVAAPEVPVADLGPAWAPPPPAGVVRARVRPLATVPAAVEPPATATERAIAGVWCAVLGRAAVGATDSFFEVGGGSVEIVVVQQRLNRLLGCELRVVDLFRYPTVRSLAAHLDGGPGDGAVERAALRGAARRARRGGVRHG